MNCLPVLNELISSEDRKPSICSFFAFCGLTPLLVPAQTLCSVGGFCNVFY